MSNSVWLPRRLLRLPVELRVALAATLGIFAINIVWAYTQANWKLDPGTATLCGAIIGLTIVGQQARRGFSNLIKSQRNQSELDREARLHQVELDRIRQLEEAEKKLNYLANALWAEVYAVHYQIHELWLSNTMFAMVSKEMAKRGSPPVAKSIAFSTFDAPVYKANIENLGLLPAGIAADVVLVMTRAKGGDNRTMEVDKPISHDLAETLHSGFAETLKDWRDDLFHVSMRLSSVINPMNQDPGPLVDAQKARTAARKAKGKV